MSMYDVSYLKTSQAYFPNALHLIVKIIPFHLGADVREYSISSALTDIKSLAISWVY